MDIKLIQTENIIFKYFQHIKIHKYFLKSTAPQSGIKDFWMIDISNILNNTDLYEHEQTVIVHFGQRMHRPRYRGRYYDTWKTAIEKISDEFIKRGIIK